MKKGFSLVELLVVVSIIAILSVMGMAVYSGVQKNARETKAKGDLDAFVKAYELKFNVASRSYPDSLVANDFVGGIPVQPNSRDYEGCDSRAGSCDLLDRTNLDRPFELCIALDSGNVCKKSAQLSRGAVNKVFIANLSSGGTSPAPTASTSPTYSTASTSTPSPSPTAAATPTPTSSPTLTAAYIQTNVGCSTLGGLTPDQICQRQVSSTSRAVPVSGTTVAKGYWWKECGGASVSNCNGLNCTVNNLDCTNTPGFWGTQQPYPSNYMKEGNNTTIYTPGGDVGCAGLSPGWTMRVYCSGSTSPIASTSPSPTPTLAACADGTNDQVYSTSMVGCNGSVNWTNKSARCAAGSHACSFAEYAARGGKTIQPTQTRWLSDTSSVAGSPLFYPVCSSTFCGSTVCYLAPPGSNSGLLTQGSLKSYSSDCGTISANNVGYIGVGAFTSFDAQGTTCCN